MRWAILAILFATPCMGQEWFGYADYLHWRADSSNIVRFYDVDHDWNSGLRTGLGCRLSDWQVTWNYTLFGSDAPKAWTLPDDGFTTYINVHVDVD